MQTERHFKRILKGKHSWNASKRGSSIQSVNYNSGPLCPWMSQTLFADASEHWFILLNYFYIRFHSPQTSLRLINDFPCCSAFLQKKVPGKMCSLQTCPDVNYFLLKVNKLTFWLWFGFWEVCFLEKRHADPTDTHILILRIKKNQIVILYISCLNLINWMWVLSPPSPTSTEYKDTVTFSQYKDAVRKKQRFLSQPLFETLGQGRLKEGPN